MKVYIITPTTFPLGLADTNRIIYYAKMLLQNGVKTEIIIYKRNNLYNNKDTKGVYENIPYHYVSGVCKRTQSVWKARLHDCYDRYALYKYLSKELKKGDVVFCYGSLYTSFIPRVTHRRKAKFVFNLCELPHVVENESWKSRTLRYFFGKVVLKNSDAVVTITKALTRYSKLFVKDDVPILEIPIIVDFSKYNMIDKSSEVDIPYIFHAGSLSESKDGFLGMVEAFGLACSEINEPLVFYSTGNITKCPHRQELEEIIRKYRLEEKLIFTNYLSDEQLKDYLSKASMVIINKYRSLQNEYCFSSKLAEYMAASKAIIVTDVGETCRWLKNNQDSVIVEPEDTKALARAIISLFNDKEKRNRLGLQANASCKKNFDYNIYSQSLYSFLTKVNNKY